MDVATETATDWKVWTIDIPEPKQGGTFMYCPYFEIKEEKKGRKVTRTVINCKFRTKNRRKYHRHWYRRHYIAAPAQPEQP